MKLVYFVHDLNDAAVSRRLDMWTNAGAEVTLLGFRRGPDRVPLPAARTVIELGQTANGRLAARAWSVLAAWARAGHWIDCLTGAEIVVGRNLECLALAAWGHRRTSGASLVFECLDIHRAMLGDRLPARLLRGVEGMLLRRCHRLLVSSPAFVTHYFKPVHRTLPQPVLLENKVLASEAGDAAACMPAAGPPWRVGWFGIIRCARSLRLLADLVRALPGHIEVEIRGRPAREVLPMFDNIVAGTPGLVFAGPYDRRVDLPKIYGGVHFAWALDFYEAGGNSDWLLPNRLYEAGLHGPVLLAAAASETGRWLEGHQAGVRLAEPLPETLYGFFAGLTSGRYEKEFGAMRKIPRKTLVQDAAICNLGLHDLMLALG